MSAAAGPPPAGEGAAPYLLVIEDDPSVQSLLQTLLVSEGYTVVTAGDGVAGLQEAARSRPALVLLDLVLPDLGGLRVLEQMKASPTLADVPVLVLSGQVDSGQDAVADLRRLLGAERVVAKPFDVSDLLTRIAELTGKAPTA